MNEELIAPCGMNCALCISYQAEKKDLNRKGFRKTYCAGCRPRGKHCVFMSKHCDLVGRGLLRFCHECSDFPCRRLKNLDKRYRTRYRLSMIENLEFIRDHGMERFLEREQGRWRCPGCGGVICCHNGLCLDCSLDILRENKTYCWGETSGRAAGKTWE